MPILLLLLLGAAPLKHRLLFADLRQARSWPVVHAEPKLPTFPVPHRASDPDWPAKGWPAAMRELVDHAGVCSPCKAITAQHVDLGTLGPGAILSVEAEGCGQGNNCFTYLVLYRLHGKLELFNFADGGGSSGYAIVLGKGRVPDLIATYDLPCCSATAQRYSFTADRFVRSGCDDLEFTDALWDMKHATIKPCAP